MGSTNPEFLAECAMARIERGYLYGADMASSRELCFDDAVALADRIIALRTAECADMATHDRPLASAGLTSYRCKGRYGYVMIGAGSHAQAVGEAYRSTPNPRNLEVWTAGGYSPIDGLPQD